MSLQTSNLMRDEVHRELRRQILDCTIPPGAELRESELADRYGVSKSPIRDALLKLETERLVVVHPRRGYQAAAISLSDAADLFDLRAILEPACARDAVARAPEAELSRLDAFRSLQAYARLRNSAEQPPFVVYNRDFHITLAGLSANRRLRDATVELIEQFDRLVIMSVSQPAAQGPEKLLAEHGAIIDALQARDGRQAGRLLADHVVKARKRVLAALSRFAVVA
ncbi:GntR family transcriptional regulator [Alsobacter metallidurans]|uniref:GntR family transcriptional regulator n=1 Tax=Alsobacter metallidurans TaxID=340221 RepID=UPI001662D8CB|nr:GntR family transcriptional regulator [Alsobacter metallidurans]